AATGRCSITYTSTAVGTDVVRARFTPPGRPEQTSTGRTVNWRSTAATATGFAWNDANNNGAWNTGETGQASVTVSDARNNNGVPAAGEPSTTTNASGQFSFGNLTPGSYRICEVVPTGWSRTYPAAPGCHSITLAAGQTLAGRSGFAEALNFGNFRN